MHPGRSDLYECSGLFIDERLCLWMGPLGFKFLIYFAPVFSVCTVESLSLFYILNGLIF